MIMTEIIITIAVGLLSFAVGYLAARAGRGALSARNEMLAADKARLEEELDRTRQENRDIAGERETYLSRVVALESQLEMANNNAALAAEAHNSRLNEAIAQAEQALANLKTENERRISELRQEHENRLAEQRRTLQGQLNEQIKLVTEQMNTATRQFLQQRSEELSNVNKEQLGNILNPLQEHIRLMREAVEKSDRDQLQTMTRLDTAIKENLRRAEEVGERADRLAKALVGDNKKQGDFGELKLRQLLENMGLEEGVQFEEQVTMRDENGNVINDDARYRPDVILHFPDNRDLIIDSKMSLTAYEHYFNAQTDADKEQALKDHVASVRQHVKELSAKAYQNRIRNGRSHLDFVVMYMFNESALQLALAQDRGLWQEAFKAGVMIVSPQNMYALLRVLEFTWKQDRQVKNQREMMDAANAIVDRVQLFCERFSKVGELLNKTREAFNEVETSTAQTGRSIVTSARQLLKFGARENSKRRPLPRPDGDESSVLSAGEDR